MSTYGTALVIDAPSAGDEATVRASLVAMGGQVWTSSTASGWHRVVTYIAELEIEALDQFRRLLAGLARARVAIAEDHDEFGARWAVLRVDDGVVSTVHRRSIINADPADPAELAAALSDLGEDPRIRDVAGATAASAAAALFEVDPARAVEAESASGRAWEDLGSVGGPFPWWDALELPWPQPGAGELGTAGDPTTP